MSHFFWRCDHFATILRAFCVAGLAMWQAAGRCPASLSPSPFPLNQTCTMQVCGVSRRGSFLALQSIGVSTCPKFWHMQFAEKIENLKILPHGYQKHAARMGGDEAGACQVIMVRRLGMERMPAMAGGHKKSQGVADG